MEVETAAEMAVAMAAERDTARDIAIRRICHTYRANELPTVGSHTEPADLPELRPILSD
jgi:hypothetical protein